MGQDLEHPPAKGDRRPFDYVVHCGSGWTIQGRVWALSSTEADRAVRAEHQGLGAVTVTEATP